MMDSWEMHEDERNVIANAFLQCDRDRDWAYAYAKRFVRFLRTRLAPKVNQSDMKKGA